MCRSRRDEHECFIVIFHRVDMVDQRHSLGASAQISGSSNSEIIKPLNWF